MRAQRIHGAPFLMMAVVLAACGERESRAPGAGADTAASTADAPVKPQLTAMPMLPGIRAHLDSLSASPAMMRSAMPGHRAEVKALVDAMHTDMMAAGMHSDAAYEALADSVVEGSAELGRASGPGFERLVARHVDQIRRLTAVYERKAAAM